MARTRIELDSSQFEALQKAVSEYEGIAGREIDNVLHTEGGKLISDEIMRLLPESGREWNGKITAAKRAQPFRQTNGSLSVTVRTKTAYNYLYFPDDGTNTKRHIGFNGKPRAFMPAGAENKTDEIIGLCINRLIKKWEE